MTPIDWAGIRCRTTGMTPLQRALTRRVYHPAFVAMCRKMGHPLSGSVTWRPHTATIPTLEHQ